jgi:CMP-N,N'-diacetyllegionaminic acid synthase
LVNKKKIIAIIPARKGSKTIKNKNIKKIDGESLVERTIHVLKKIKLINQTALSTDSKKMQKIAINKKIWCKFLRPKNISGKNSTTNDAVAHVLKNINNKFDYIFEIHPTYFFRKSQDIVKCFEILKKTNANSLITVSKIKSCAHKDFQISLKKNYIKFKKLPHTFNKLSIKNSFEFNGYIIMSKYQHFLKYGNHFGKGNKCIGFEIKDRKTLIDINDHHDLRLVKALNRKQ